MARRDRPHPPDGKRVALIELFSGRSDRLRYTSGMAGLSSQQIGKVAEGEFYKLLILGSNGRLEPTPALADEEGWDASVHLKGRPERPILFQVKCATRLVQNRRQLGLVKSIRWRRHRFAARGWFFLAHLDVRAMAFADPVFVIPSREVRFHMRAGLLNGHPEYKFHASMAEDSRDRWVPYRVSPSNVGKRVVDILEALPLAAQRAA